MELRFMAMRCNSSCHAVLGEGTEDDTRGRVRSPLVTRQDEEFANPHARQCSTC